MHPKAIEALKAKRGKEDITKEEVTTFISNTTKDEAFHYAEMGIPTAPVYYASEATKDPPLAAREIIVEVNHPILGNIKACNFPLKMSETPGKILSAAPLLGQHQKEIVTGLLGYSSEEFEQLV